MRSPLTRLKGSLKGEKVRGKNQLFFAKLTVEVVAVGLSRYKQYLDDN